ncbi:hypothetical protein BC826DRAFT_1104757 [Russula brevipes]|nr:hypothetical protein BC826DRAFT_1104757 [Russula brevipes]
MRDIVFRDDTLAEAETQRDAAFLGQLHATRAETSALRQDFDDLHRQHHRTLDQLDLLRGELSEAHKTITQLRDDEAAQNAHGDTPRRRKVARQEGTSPSPSRFSSRPDSLLLEDHVAVMNPDKAKTRRRRVSMEGNQGKGNPPPLRNRMWMREKDEGADEVESDTTKDTTTICIGERELSSSSDDSDPYRASRFN